MPPSSGSLWNCQAEALPATSYADIQEFVQALVPLFADCQKPFAFFGHSFGALLSFLICRALAERQLPCHAA